MPIHVGADNIVPVMIGNVAVVSGYVGSDKVYGYDPNQVLTLTSTTDLDLATFIAGTSADYAKPIIINLASDQIIGGVSAPAFSIVGLPTHVSITINISGQIQGHASGHAVVSDEPLDIISTGEIAGGIIEGINQESASITFVVSSTGKVLAGGGNGGNGGRGGDGSEKSNCGQYYFSTAVPQFFYRDHGYESAYYNNVSVGYPAAGSIFFIKSPYVYEKGSYRSTATIGVQGDEFEIRRCNLLSGSGGAGGNGGLGAGYNQVRTDGADGVKGINRAGSGGQGGNGGDWGVSGGTGQSGGTGLYISPYNEDATRAGALGTEGVDAGKAFLLYSSTVRYFGIDSPQAKALGL